MALAVGLAGRRGGVAVSRGELVEIGGGVRIPEIVRRAGARLIEVGTTNRTRVADFEAALADGSARLVLRVHPSNFVQEGFVEAPDPLALAELAHRHGALVIDDLGSGALLPTERFGLAHEPMPSERLAAGSDIVTFSGDKLVGGPQAGLVVGRADLIARIRRDPFARAMRPDKTTLAALAATLGLYRAGRAEAEIPVWQMLAQRPDDLRARADAIAGELGVTGVSVIATLATVGGGSLPGETLPSWGLTLGEGKGLEGAARPAASRRPRGGRTDRRRPGHAGPSHGPAGARRRPGQGDLGSARSGPLVHGARGRQMCRWRSGSAPSVGQVGLPGRLLPAHLLGLVLGQVEVDDLMLDVGDVRGGHVEHAGEQATRSHDVVLAHLMHGAQALPVVPDDGPARVQVRHPHVRTLAPSLPVSSRRWT